MGYQDFRKGEQDAFNELQNKYQPSKYCPTARQLKEEIAIINADLSKKAIGSDYWSGYYRMWKNRADDINAFYRFGDCDNYFAKKKLEVVGEVIEKESVKYEEIVSAQTSKQNKIVLFIGASIMIVGTIIILRKK